MREHIEPVDLPGLPPLNRHTYYDEEGNPLQQVKYTLRPPDVPEPPRDWVGLVLTVVVTALAATLSLACFLGS